MSKRPPSRIYYLLAVAIVLAGSAFCGWTIYQAIRNMGGELQQIVVPSRTTILLRERGTYTIFHEYRSVVDGRVFNAAPDVPGLHVTVASESGRAIDVKPARMSSTYEFGGREGVAVFQFDVDEPGRFVLRAAYDIQSGQPTVLAVGRRFIGRLLGRVFGGLAVLFTSGLIAFLLALVTFIKRKKAASTDLPHSTAF